MVNCFFLINNPKLNFQFSFPKAIIIGKEIIRTPSGVQQHFPLLDKKNDFKNAGYQFKIETQTLITYFKLIMGEILANLKNIF